MSDKFEKLEALDIYLSRPEWGLVCERVMKMAEECHEVMLGSSNPEEVMEYRRGYLLLLEVVKMPSIVRAKLKKERRNE